MDHCARHSSSSADEERSVGSASSASSAGGPAEESPGAETTLTPVRADEGSDWRYRDSAVDIEAPPQGVDVPVDGCCDSSEDSRSHEDADAPYLLGAPGRTPHPSSSHRKRHLVPWGEAPLKKSASSGSSSDMGFETSSTESETEGSETSSPTMDRPCVLTIVASDEECAVELQETMSAGTASTAVEHPAATPSIVAACSTPPRRPHRSGGAGGTVRRRTGSISSDGSCSGGGGFMPSPPSSTLKARRERLVRTPPPAACTLGAIRTGSSFGSALPPLEGSFAQSSSRSSTPSQSSSLSSSLSSSSRGGRRGRQHPLSFVQSPRAPSPQTPQSCPEYFDCDSPDDSQDDSRHEAAAADDLNRLSHRRLRSEDISNAMIQSPDLYVYCTDEGAARECRYEDEGEANNDQVSIDLEPPLDGGRNNLPRRRIHWAASPRHHHRSQYRRSTIGKHRRKQQHHHRSSPLPSDAVASHQSSLSTFLTTPLVMTPGTLLRLFLSASLAAFVLAQSYALAVHRVWGTGIIGGTFSPWADAPGFGTHFGMPLGGDGPLGKYGARGLGEALEEERMAILSEIGDVLTRTPSSSVATAAGAAGDKKFDVRLAPRSGRSDLLRTSAEALKLCPSVGDVRVEERRGGEAGAADDDAKAGIAAANGDGPPPRESPGGGGKPATITKGADAVLVLADDVAFTCEELDRAFAVWSSDPRRAVGFFPRRGRGAGSSREEGSSAYAALSDRAIFVHRSVYGSLARRVVASSSSSSSSNVGGSEPRDRCQDLALSVAASYVSSEAPLAVKSRPLRLVEDENSVSSFEEEGGDDDDTALCLSRLASSLGMKVEDLPTEERVYLGGGGATMSTR